MLGGCTSRCRPASGEVAGWPLNSRVEESGRATSIEASAVLMRVGDSGSLPGSLLPRCSWPVGAHQLAWIQRTLEHHCEFAVSRGGLAIRKGDEPDCKVESFAPGKSGRGGVRQGDGRRSPHGARVWVRSVAWVSPSGPVTQDRTARRLRAVVDAEDCGTIWRAPGISCRLTGERRRGLAGSSIVVLADALSLGSSARNQRRAWVSSRSFTPCTPGILRAVRQSRPTSRSCP